MKKCCIISAGDVNLALLKKRKDEYSFFIAADAGFEKVILADIIPNIVVGDFDSISQFPIIDKPSTTSDTLPKVIQFPIEKDYSDTHLAIEEGIKQGFTHFDVYGALGGDRFSHSLANLQTLCTMKSKGISVTLIGMKESVYILKNETLTLSPPIGCNFSVFSLSDESKHVTINGAKYSLENATLTNLFPLGVSNQSTDKEIQISVKNGFLLVILEF